MSQEIENLNSNVICILGPTASGKTKYAVSLAASIGAEIISADSRQLYKGMDIGTGKDLNEYSFNGVNIPYHLIDIVEPGYTYSIFEYQRDFHKAYKEIIGRGKRVIVCGGSGLYIEAALTGYKLHQVVPDAKLREELEQYSDATLIEMLKEHKELHNTTDTTSRKRLIRALEIAIHSKKERESSHESISPQYYPPISTHYIGIDVSREERIARIDRRLDERLKNGMIEEVEGLLKSGISPANLIYYGLEYKFVTLYLIGELEYNQMRNALATAIHQFAKRQMTWFRGMERRGIKIEWIKV